GISLVRLVKDVSEDICSCEYVCDARIDKIDLGKGSATVCVNLKNNLFYKILGEETGLEVANESELFSILRELTGIRKQFEKIKGALEEVEATGYGIVMPEIDELSLEEPEIVKQGGRYGVRLKASAPSLHIMKTCIKTEISPIVGSEKQSEELVKYLLDEFEENPRKIWDSNIFGKSLNDLVNEGLHNKLYHLPVEARLKLQETLERIINEGCSGLICFIL
ncbi:MAG: stage IV sporulation protein A, partial [Oscillospiraceae bacterium]